MSDGTTGYGSVSYTYNIGTYDVTTAQYCDFLNNKAKADPYGLWNSYMALYLGCNIQRSGSNGSFVYTIGSGSASDIANWGNRPVYYVSYWEACRFANWLGNGQGNGDTETGAYTLNGYNGDDGRTIARNAGATWAVTSEDEWYKAAYYKGGGTNAGYWLYPTQSNSAPTAQAPPGGKNSANYDLAAGNATYGYTSNVGAYTASVSAYGTFDQGGNIWEWNEGIAAEGAGYAYRGARGGSCYENTDNYLQSSYRDEGDPSNLGGNVGFRVVELVPEPSSIIALLCGVGGMCAVIRRKRQQ